MISADLLRRLRNDLPMPVTIAALGRDGPPSKMSEGYFRFLCPHCGEMRATVNPRNNLAHCFCCKKNLNNIDLLSPSATTSAPPSRSWNAGSTNTRPSKQTENATRSAVSRRPLSHASPIPTIRNAPGDLPNPVAPSFSKILNNSGNRPSPRQNPYSLIWQQCDQNLVRHTQIRSGTLYRRPSWCGD